MDYQKNLTKNNMEILYKGGVGSGRHKTELEDKISACKSRIEKLKSELDTINRDTNPTSWKVKSKSIQSQKTFLTDYERQLKEL